MSTEENSVLRSHIAARRAALHSAAERHQQVDTGTFGVEVTALVEVFRHLIAAEASMQCRRRFQL